MKRKLITDYLIKFKMEEILNIKIKIWNSDEKEYFIIRDGIMSYNPHLDLYILTFDFKGYEDDYFNPKMIIGKGKHTFLSAEIIDQIFIHGTGIINNTMLELHLIRVNENSQTTTQSAELKYMGREEQPRFGCDFKFKHIKDGIATIRNLKQEIFLEQVTLKIPSDNIEKYLAFRKQFFK